MALIFIYVKQFRVLTAPPAVNFARRRRPETAIVTAFKVNRQTPFGQE